MDKNNYIAIAPGETIKEQLNNRGMSQKEFAIRMGMSEKHISHLINGKVELTVDMSIRLESVLGIPAKFWSNLEALYREQLARIELEKNADEDMQIMKFIPYSKMVSMHWISPAKSNSEKIQNLRSYFEVARLGVINDLYIPGLVYRVNSTKSNNYALLAWAQKAKQESRKTSAAVIDIEKLKNCIPRLRNQTTVKIDDAYRSINSILSDCGVVLVILPQIKGSYLQGASFVDGNHVVLGLTDRGKTTDIFWFSFFHEVYHIINKDIYNLGKENSKLEKAADDFAANTLISPEDYTRFVNDKNYTAQGINGFAKQIEMDPGIVVGRMQREKLIPYNKFNCLKTRYKD